MNNSFKTYLYDSFIFFSFILLISCNSKNEEKDIITPINDIVEVDLGSSSLYIPSNYLSPKRENINKLFLNNMVEVTVFLPDYRGYHMNEEVTAESLKNRISLAIDSIKSGSRRNASERLKRSLKYKLVRRNISFDKYNLIAYKSLKDNDISYLGYSKNGYKILFDCHLGGLNDICSAEYFDKKNKLGLFFIFDKLHLKDWNLIDQNIHLLVQGWKRIKNT